MTYCLAVRLDSGLVFASDSRTNAGVDHVSTYSKMFRIGAADDRQLVMLSAGNLATTQGVMTEVQRDIRDGAIRNLLNLASIEDGADYLGAISVKHQQKITGGGSAFEASFILGGQISNQPPEIMLIYPHGNHIRATIDTPYLQIGESKYGKPILDRIIATQTSLDQAALCALVSMDSTIRSNLTVGPPIELCKYQRDSLHMCSYLRLEHDNLYLRDLKRNWEDGLRNAFAVLPPINWS